MAEPDPTLKIRWPTLLASFGVVLTISLVALRFWQSRGGDLPPVPPLLAALLGIVAVPVLVLGLRVRRWVRAGTPIDPLGATRTLVLGQTAALAGALVAGYPAAVLALALLRLHGPEPRAVALGAVLAVLAASLTSVAGMVTQWCCLVPPEDEDDRDDGLRAR